jgi:hypothetical protein
MIIRFFPFALLALSVGCKPAPDRNKDTAAVTTNCADLTEAQAISDANAALSRGDHVLKGVAFGGFDTGVDTPGVYSSAMPAKRFGDPGYRVDVIAGQFGSDVRDGQTKARVIGGPRCQQKLIEYSIVFNNAMLAGDPAYALHFGTAASVAGRGQPDKNFEKVNVKRKGWRAFILRPLNDPGDWITSADREIPIIAEAIRSKEFKGSPGSPPLRTFPNVTSTLLIEVGAKGEVSRCVANSIEIDAGNVACDLVRRRARFSPMRRADGSPRSSSWEFYVDWGNEQRPLKTSGGIRVE